MLSQPIVNLLAALSTAGVKDFNKVAGAANFAAVKEDLKNQPAAYVIPMADRASPNKLGSGAISQRVTERFAVVMALDNKRDTRGDAVNAALEAKRAKVIDALIGVMPSAAYDPVEYQGGQLLALDVTTTYWQLEFTTAYQYWRAQ